METFAPSSGFERDVKVIVADPLTRFGHGKHRAGDAVAFSEKQLALREIQRVSEAMGAEK